MNILQVLTYIIAKHSLSQLNWKSLQCNLKKKGEWYEKKIQKGNLKHKN